MASSKPARRSLKFEIATAERRCPNFPVPDAEEVADGVERDRFVRHDDAVDIAKAHGMIDDRERSFNRFESIEERIGIQNGFSGAFF